MLLRRYVFLNSVPNALIVEFVVQEGTTLRDLITLQRIQAEESYLKVPDNPGLGIDLDEKAIQRLSCPNSLSIRKRIALE